MTIIIIFVQSASLVRIDVIGDRQFFQNYPFCFLSVILRFVNIIITPMTLHHEAELFSII